MRFPNLLAVATAAVLWLPITGANAHEGHDHDAPKAPVSATIAPRTEASSGEFELVAIARGGELVVHLDAFETNAPISGADVEVDTPAGLVKAAAKGEGIYHVSAPFLAVPGRYDLAFTIAAAGTVDVLAATLTIPETQAAERTPVGSSWFAGPAIAKGLKQNLGGRDLPIWMALAIGFAAGVGAMALWGRRKGRTIATVVVSVAAILSTAPSPAAAIEITAAARDQAQRLPDSALFVPKATQHILALRSLKTAEQVHQRTLELPGRIIPDPNASGLVQASTGGRLSPPPGGFKALGTPVKAGDVLAFVMPPLPIADSTTQQQQARELDQQISIVTRKVERLRTIQQVIAKSQLEDAELELKGLQARRANLDRVRREPEALVSPVGGIIAAFNAVAGQMAEPNAVIFQIVDPASLWVEALSYEAQAMSGRARAQLANGKTADLDYVGTGFTDRNQAVPIHFAITSDTKGLRAGQFVTVLASTLDQRTGIAVPREAVLRGGNGQSLVYEHTNAERFVEREVRVEPLDGTNVLIVAGIEPGRRIVTQGAELLNQIR